MPRRNFNDGVELVIEDFNAIPKAVEKEIFERLAYEILQRKENSFFQDGFLVSYSSPNSIIVNSGYGIQTDLTQSSPESKRRPLHIEADTTKVIDSPDSVNNRIDIVCVKAALVDELSGSRHYKDATSGVISLQNFVIQKDWVADIQIVAGTPAIAPVAPAVPVGYIKIATLLVAAVGGLSGAGAVTDNRTLMPIGGLSTINTVGFNRLPASAAETMNALFLAIDSLLKNGYFEYYDLDVLTVDPANPSAGKRRVFFKDDVLYIKDNLGAKTPVGSGGGGGGGAIWEPMDIAPLEDYEYSSKVWKFSPDLDGQAVQLVLKVPSSFIPGRPIKMRFAAYSPGAANKWQLQAKTTLIRKNNDAVTSTTNQITDATGDVTNTVANRYLEQELDLTSALGTINSLAVQSGDLIKIELTRIAASSLEDTNDIRFLPSTTEVLFT